jgi:hypothetical protein
MTNIQNIETILARMAELLHIGGCDNWVRTLNKYHREIANNPSGTAASIRVMYGGMGSFNDLVLYRNGQLLRAENDEFDALRSELYQLCYGILVKTQT